MARICRISGWGHSIVHGGRRPATCSRATVSSPAALRPRKRSARIWFSNRAGSRRRAKSATSRSRPPACRSRTMWSTRVRPTPSPRENGAPVTAPAELARARTPSGLETRPSHLVAHRDIDPCDEGSEDGNDVRIGERQEERRNREAYERQWEVDGRQVKKSLLGVSLEPGTGQAAPHPHHADDPADDEGAPENQAGKPQLGADLYEGIVRRGPANRVARKAAPRLVGDRAFRPLKVVDPDPDEGMVQHVAEPPEPDLAAAFLGLPVVVSAGMEHSADSAPIARRRGYDKPGDGDGDEPKALGHGHLFECQQQDASRPDESEKRAA